jgi:hypothetical protein
MTERAATLALTARGDGLRVSSGSFGRLDGDGKHETVTGRVRLRAVGQRSGPRL